MSRNQSIYILLSIIIVLGGCDSKPQVHPSKATSVVDGSSRVSVVGRDPVEWAGVRLSNSREDDHSTVSADFVDFLKTLPPWIEPKGPFAEPTDFEVTKDRADAVLKFARSITNADNAHVTVNSLMQLCVEGKCTSYSFTDTVRFFKHVGIDLAKRDRVDDAVQIADSLLMLAFHTTRGRESTLSRFDKLYFVYMLHCGTSIIEEVSQRNSNYLRTPDATSLRVIVENESKVVPK